MEDNNSTSGLSAAEMFLQRWQVDAAQDAPIHGDEGQNTTDNSDLDTNDAHDSDLSEVETDEKDVSGDHVDGQTDEETEANSAKYADDDFVVKVSVDGSEREFKVADLKRLAGQEVALRHKSEEVATKRKAMEEDGARYVAATEKLLTRAAERYAPYQNIDWAEAAATLDPEDYRALKVSAQQAYQDIQFYTTELDAFMGQVHQQRHQGLIEEAKATLTELTDKDRGIPGFGEQMYSEMRQFANSQGIPNDVLDTLVSAPALRIIHMAMMHHKGKSAPTTKVVKTPTNVVKSRTNVEVTRKATAAPQNDAMKRLKNTGSVDDVKAALMSRWQGKSKE